MSNKLFMSNREFVEIISWFVETLSTFVGVTNSLE